jgi:hypothetical protein
MNERSNVLKMMVIPYPSKSVIQKQFGSLNFPVAATKRVRNVYVPQKIISRNS